VTIVAVTSLHGAPGASTLALELALHVGRVAAGPAVLLLEADPDGGVLAARHGLKLQPCLTDLCSVARRSLDESVLRQHCQSFAEGVEVVVAHPSAEATSAALRAGAAQIAGVLGRVEADVVVDPGRFRPGSPASRLLDIADQLVVVLRPELADVMVVLHGLEAMRERTVLVLAGSSPYSPRQVAEVTGMEVVAVLGEARKRRAADPLVPLASRLGLGTRPTSEPIS